MQTAAAMMAFNALAVLNLSPHLWLHVPSLSPPPGIASPSHATPTPSAPLPLMPTVAAMLAFNAMAMLDLLPHL